MGMAQSQSSAPMTDATFKPAFQEYLADPVASAAKHGPIGEWDVAQVTRMAHLFVAGLNDDAVPGAETFNADISAWNTSSVVSMKGMFFNAAAFDQPIGGFNTAAVADMHTMFAGAKAFNRPIGGWETAAVTDMHGMFLGAKAFDQAIGGWKTAAVTDMYRMFYKAKAFDRPIGGWATAAVEGMAFMFEGAASMSDCSKASIGHGSGFSKLWPPKDRWGKLPLCTTPATTPTMYTTSTAAAITAAITAAASADARHCGKVDVASTTAFPRVCTSLSLSRVPAHRVAAFAKAMARPNVLTSLALRHSGITDATASVLAAAVGARNPRANLDFLDLSFNRITDAGAIALATEGLGSVVHLALGGNTIGDAGAVALAGALATGGTVAGLTFLDLHGNAVGDAGAIAIAGALARTGTTLGYLNLRDNAISDDGATALATAATAATVAGGSPLTHLNLYGNSVTESAAAALSTLLATPGNALASLNLGGNGIGDEGMVVLANGITSKHARLAHLDVRDNAIGVAGAAALATALAIGGARLTSLRLGGNDVPETSRAALEACLGLPAASPERRAAVASLLVGLRPCGGHGTPATPSAGVGDGGVSCDCAATHVGGRCAHERSDLAEFLLPLGVELLDSVLPLLAASGVGGVAELRRASAPAALLEAMGVAPREVERVVGALHATWLSRATASDLCLWLGLPLLALVFVRL